MSATRSWTIHCDGCGECISTGDLGDRTASQGRESARHDGAHVNLPGGRDICSACWDEGKR